MAWSKARRLADLMSTSAGVPTASIQDNAVTSAKIGVDVIVAEDLDANSVTVSELASNAVTTAKIADSTGASDGVTTAKIADDAVTLAKMDGDGSFDGKIITYDASGNPVHVGPGTDGQVLTSTGAGSPPAFEDAASGGALPTVIDQWRITSSYEASGNELPLATNLARSTINGGAFIGTGMTESSGTFTFPSTGIWEIYASVGAYASSTIRYFQVGIMTTIDNWSALRWGSLLMGNWSNDSSLTGYMAGTGQCLFDVTDTSNCKVRFYMYTPSALYILGDADGHYSYFIFKRLGDT